MSLIKTFDVLVVYTSAVASSASKKDISSPFQKSAGRTHYDNAYSYLLQTCQEIGLTAAFTTSEDISDGGTTNCYWIFQSHKWVKINQPCYSELIFDKLSPNTPYLKKQIDLLFSHYKVTAFNSYALFSLFYDKQNTFNKLKEFTIPTVSLRDNSLSCIKQALREIEVLTFQHVHHRDFSNRFVLKDRFGSGGENVYLINNVHALSEIHKITKRKKHTLFILQPFAQFETGYMYKKTAGFTDIRMIYIGSNLKQVYIRRAKKQDFRCNEHQGGQLDYVSPRDIPAYIHTFAQKVVRKINASNELYALDFVVSNNGNVFLMEGNIRPGIDWNLTLKKNERMAKKLIRSIVGELKKRIISETPTPKITPVFVQHTALNSLNQKLEVQIVI